MQNQVLCMSIMNELVRKTCKIMKMMAVGYDVF